MNESLIETTNKQEERHEIVSLTTTTKQSPRKEKLIRNSSKLANETTNSRLKLDSTGSSNLRIENTNTTTTTSKQTSELIEHQLQLEFKGLLDNKKKTNEDNNQSKEATKDPQQQLDDNQSISISNKDVEQQIHNQR